MTVKFPGREDVLEFSALEAGLEFPDREDELEQPQQTNRAVAAREIVNEEDALRMHRLLVSLFSVGSLPPRVLLGMPVDFPRSQKSRPGAPGT
jgi:hypothetical protein